MTLFRKWLLVVVVLSVAAMLAGGAQGKPDGAPPNATSPLGSNLASVVDYSGELPFVNVFKTARRWLPQCDEWSDPACTSGWDTGEYELLDLDEDGWVRSLPDPEDPPMYTHVGTVLFQYSPINGGYPQYPAGQYIVLYDGEGTIQYDFAAEKDVAASTPGRDVVDVDPSQGGGIYLRIVETDPNGTGDYIRNIRMLLPGHEDDYDSQVFYPAFLNTIDKYRSLRFMNWMRTNDVWSDPNTQQEWSDRPLPDDAIYAGGDGVPLEVMISLSNRVLADPWFTLPHMASDDYVTQFATMARDNLDPGLRVYVEYSNEVWNGIFGQGAWIEAQGQAEWPDDPASGFTKRLNWFGKRTAEICDIWKTVWGPESDRVVCVMGAQAANSWTASQALSCPLWDQGPCVDHGIDAVAIAPYFGGYLGNPGNETEVQGWTNDADGGLDRLFAELTDGGELSGGPAGGAIQQAAGWMAASKTVADQFGIDLIAYEGGQHLVGHGGVENNAAVTALFLAANRDPRMGNVYGQYFDTWRAQGGRMFAHFTNADVYSKWGSWGALEYTDQGSAPKHDALMAFIDDNACWWPDCEYLGGNNGGGGNGDYYVCDCGPGADADCTAGDDANSGTDPSTPWQTYERARTAFSGLAAGDTIHFCRGGAFTIGGSAEWVNGSCTADVPCTVTDYTPAWASGDEGRPLITTAGGHGFSLANGGNGEHQEGYLFSNLDLRCTGCSPGPHFGFFLYNDIDDVTIDNVRVDSFAIGVHVSGSNPCGADPACDGRNDRITLTNSTIVNNWSQGWLGSGDGVLIDGNFFQNNGSEPVFDHNLYYSGSADTTGSVISNNELYQSSIRENGSCQGVSLVVHGTHSDLTIAGNLVREDVGQADQGCWGIAVDPGYSEPESFTNVQITGNEVQNVGNVGIGVASCVDCLIENNVVIHEQAFGTRAIAAPDRARNSDDAMMTDVQIRNNAVYVTNGGGTGITLGGEGSGHVLVSNAVRYSGGGTNWACVDADLPAGDYDAIDYNVCGYDAGQWAAGVGDLPAWQAAGWGAHSQAADPGFTGVYDLSPASGAAALVDAGHPTLSAPADVAGNARVGAPDAGAYEWLTPPAGDGYWIYLPAITN